MKIGYNAKFLSVEQPGGAAKASYRVLSHLIEEDRTNQYVVFTNKVKQDVDRIKSKNVALVESGSYGSKVGRLFWEQAILPKLVREHGVDLLHNSMTGSPFLLPDIPTVITIHDLGYLNREWFSPTFSWWYRLMVPRAARRASRIIAVSNFTRDEIGKHLGAPDSKIDVVYNGIDEIYKTGPEDPSEFDLDLPDKYLLFVGSLNPRKNLKNTIRAFRRAREEYDLPHELLVVGASKDIFAREDFTRSEAVRFPGYMTDRELKQVYARADLLLFPTLYEGFGLPPLEAMSQGTPVITSGRTSLPEVVGDAAVFVDPYDIEEITGKIKEVLENRDLRKTLMDKGESRAAEFSWDKAAKETLEVYERVYEENGQ